jgi:uncharacterized protein YeaO (DUF488 family)
MRNRLLACRIRIKRAYVPAAPADGMRILVDRLWPRGLKKSNAAIDRWLKELAPSTALRRWFDHDPARWPEFRRRYAAELRKQPESLKIVRRLASTETVTLIFAARDERRNDAVVLRGVLLGRPQSKSHRLAARG